MALKLWRTPAKLSLAKETTLEVVSSKHSLFYTYFFTQFHQLAPHGLKAYLYTVGLSYVGLLTL